MKPIPDNIKAILAKLEGPEQAVMKGYIGTLRAEIKELKEEAVAKSDPDPLAHYHGDEKCTEDHSHGHDHKKEDKHEHKHKHKNHDSHEHKHEHSEHSSHSKSHEHNHGHKGEECQKEACTDDHDHKHEHKHSQKEACTDDHDHKHEHKHEHKHKKHAEETTAKEEIPAWKKKALESGDDPHTAPFGGTWTAESSISAKPEVTMAAQTENKMEEETLKADDTAVPAENKMEE